MNVGLNQRVWKVTFTRFVGIQFIKSVDISIKGGNPCKNLKKSIFFSIIWIEISFLKTQKDYCMDLGLQINR